MGMSPKLLRPRATGFNPKSISGLQLWLDASDLSTVTQATGVSEWRDKSPTGSKWIQETGNNQPATGTQTINGKNVLVFDGSNDWLSAVTPLATAMPLSMFIVQRIVSGTSFGMTYTAATGFNVRQTGASTGTLSILPGASNTGQARTGINDILSLMYPASGNNALYLNGTTLTLDDVSTRPTLTGTHSIGVRRATDGSLAFYANVWIAEIIAYSTALTTTQRVAVQKYLGTKWGITVA
jgi:hypothetical protein